MAKMGETVRSQPMSGENKTTLDEIVAGDEVAYKDGSYSLSRRIADKVTATQIVIGSARFRKSDGSETGTGYWRATIYPLGKIEKTYYGEPRGTYLQVIEIEQAEHADENQRYKLARWISEQLGRDLARKFDAATLEQAARLLGYTGDK